MADRASLETADISEMEMQQFSITWRNVRVNTGTPEEPTWEWQQVVRVVGSARNPRTGAVYEHSELFANLGTSTERAGAVALKDDFLGKLMDRYFAPEA